MRIARLLLILVGALLISSCPAENGIYRGYKDGKMVQKIIASAYDPSIGKAGRTIQAFDYDRNKMEWVPSGPPKKYDDGDSDAEVGNFKKYSGNAGDPPNSATISTPNNVYLANNYGDNELIVFSASTLDEITRIPVNTFIGALDASPDGLTVAALARTRIFFIDVVSSRITRTLNLPATANIKNIHFSNDASRMFVSDDQAGILVYDLSSLSLIQAVPRPAGINQIESSALSPDGEYLFVRTSGSNSSAIFDLASLTFTTGANAGRATFFSGIPCVFHSTGKEIYCISLNGVAILDSVAMTVVDNVALPIPASENIYRLNAVDEGDYLLVTSDNGVHLIDTSARKVVSTLKPPTGQIFKNAYPVNRF